MTSNDQSGTRVDRFHGPDYLTRFEPDPMAIERLSEVRSETAHRLKKWTQGHWPGALSTEDYLAPLAQTGGDVVLRVVQTPGSDWVWWAGKPLDKHFYHRVAALPNYQDHKVVSRRKGHPDRLAELLDGASVVPVHAENVPESIRRCMENDRPYK